MGKNSVKPEVRVEQVVEKDRIPGGQGKQESKEDGVKESKEKRPFGREFLS